MDACEALPPAGALVDLAGWLEESFFRLSSLAPSSRLDFPAEDTGSGVAVRMRPHGQVYVEQRPKAHIPFSFLVWAGVGDLELAEDTGLARSAYMSSESTLCTELLLEVALDTEDTLLTLKDLHTHTHTPAREALPWLRGRGVPSAWAHSGSGPRAVFGDSGNGPPFPYLSPKPTCWLVCQQG